MANRLALKSESIRILSDRELAATARGAHARVLQGLEACDQEVKVVGIAGGRHVAICTSDGFGALAAKYMR